MSPSTGTQPTLSTVSVRGSSPVVSMSSASSLSSDAGVVAGWMGTR